MTDLIVFEDAGYRGLLPLTYWRAAFDLRCGVDSLLEKIEQACGAQARLVLRSELAEVVAGRDRRELAAASTDRPVLFVNGRLLLRARPDMPLGAAAWQGDVLLAAHLPSAYVGKLTADVLLDTTRTREALAGAAVEELPAESFALLDAPWQLVSENGAELRRQLAMAPAAISGKVAPGAVLVNDAKITIEQGAVVRAGAVLDAEAGPVYVAGGAVISPNAVVQGPAYVGPNTLVQPLTLIRENTSLGPWCKVGGELESTIIHGYSNKQHHGFLGHAYVAEWVNLGAGTVNSDLKNTYGPVRVPINGREIDTGQTFVGCFIGDHAKTGINVAIPTGAVIGFAANVFTSRHPPKFTPSFSWLTDGESTRYDPERAIAVARKVMARRKVTLSAGEERLFLRVAESAATDERTSG